MAYKEKDTKKWTAQWFETNAKGEKKKRRKRGFETKREALEYERQKKLNNSRSMDMKLSEFMEVYFEDKQNELKERTMKNKRYMMEQHIIPYFGNQMIVIAQNKKNREHMVVTDMREFTNINVLPVSDNIPEAVITFLDPSVESLKFENNENKTIIRLKFVQQEEIILNNAKELDNYLSSGTIKGIVVFTQAMKVLGTGGYMVVDEIENHFNKEIVSTLIRFFMDIRLNKNGAVLIFTTHYPELLDEYDRNDSIFITRNRNGITIENISKILTRNDIKKSDAYQSGFLEGTTPAYDAYMKLKKSISSHM